MMKATLVVVGFLVLVTFAKAAPRKPGKGQLSEICKSIRIDCRKSKDHQCCQKVSPIANGKWEEEKGLPEICNSFSIDCTKPESKDDECCDKWEEEKGLPEICNSFSIDCTKPESKDDECCEGYSRRYQRRQKRQQRKSTGDIVKKDAKEDAKEDRGEDIIEDNKESMTAHMHTDIS